jgi:hypothetical protein
MVVGGCGGSNFEPTAPQDSDIAGDAGDAGGGGGDGGPDAGDGGEVVPSEADGGCVSLQDPSAPIWDPNLLLTYACGGRTVAVSDRSPFAAEGDPCAVWLGSLNTFAMKLAGPARSQYSAVVRCGYIPVDNGTFVGSRVVVEARDGEWCDDVAFQSIDSKHDILLTDVAFSIERVAPEAPSRGVTAQFTIYVGASPARTPLSIVPNGTSVCAYVADRMLGASSCTSAPPSPDCVCPCDPAWGDTFASVTLSLVSP